MDPAFWHDRWQRSDIGFHQKSAHELLVKHWPALALPRGTTVFVPLCGKSLDMVWLAEAGHKIIGVELSRLAVEAFFTERGITPTVETAGAYRFYRSASYTLVCGDVFELPEATTREAAAVFDRAALVAMPPAMQSAYAAKLTKLAPSEAPIILVTLDYDPSEMSGPPFPVPRGQIERLFGARFDIEPLEERHVIDSHPHFRTKGLTWLTESLTFLRRR